MRDIGCVLVNGEGTRSPEALRSRLEQLRELIGPELPVHVHTGAKLALEPLAGVQQLRGTGGQALAVAAACAAAAAKHLLVLGDAVAPDPSVLCALAAGFDLDPMVGMVQPRFGDAAGEGIWSLPGGPGEPPALLPRSVLPLLPPHELTPERLAACLAIRFEVATGLRGEPEGTALIDALVEQLCHARRCGFRNLVLNRVVVPSSARHSVLYPTLAPAARASVESRLPDVTAADAWFTRVAERRIEPVLAQARRRRPADPLRVLIDCRGVPDFFNGTAQAILGLLDGLQEELPAWSTELLFSDAAAAFHGAVARYPAMRVITSLPEATYAAAVRLDQPWHLSTVGELHRRACAITFNVLDTIAWDVIYLAGKDLGVTWRFVAAHADGLIYNSQFTQERFRFRFPIAPGSIHTVTLHQVDAPSLAPRAEAPDADHLLVFGNDYEHKAISQTVDLLCRTFPFQRIEVVGPHLDARPNVRALPSGRIPEAEIERLTATARAVIFPSWYEGFGLPVVKALALGRTVIVRASPLWNEIGGLSRGPGRLVDFVTLHDLVEVVGRTLAGEKVPGLPLGTALHGAPPTWRECARRLVDHVSQTVAGFDVDRWCTRDRALALAGVLAS